jgi:hypothetical protein
MHRQLILGLGTGQCGTELLAQILDQQPNTQVSYEQPPFLRWQPRPRGPGLRQKLERMLATRRARFVGDVANYHLPYVEEALSAFPDIRLICLSRPREEVIHGFCRLDHGSRLPLDHWSRVPIAPYVHDFLRTRTYPQYDVTDRRAGIGRYWDEYQQRAEELARRYPDHFRRWDTEALTTEGGVQEVLDFVGIPRGDQNLIVGRKPPVDQLTSLQSPFRALHPMDPRRCVILVPFNGFIHQECEDGLKELERRGYHVRRVGGYAAIDQGRNQMATDALMDGFEETIWIDSDVGFHPDAIEQLRSHPQPMVCGIYPQKGKRALACHVAPGSPSMTFGQRGGLTELLYAGTGFLMIRREAYLQIFEQLDLEVCNERFGHPTIPFFLPMVREIEEGHWYLAEDYAFCERARTCGIPIYADTSIRLWHIGYYRYGWEDAGLERQRFGTFTLNFGEWSATASDTLTNRPPAILNFSNAYPWPSKKPEPPAFPQRNWLFPGTQEALASCVNPATSLIVEVGSWTGRSTRFLAGLAPSATIIAIDHWQGSPEHSDDAELSAALPHLYDTFLSECWNYRDQIIPVRLKSVEGLQRVAEAGLKPDVVYIDADHTYDAVIEDLTAALDLFPTAHIVGDDFNWDDVRRAVETIATQRGLTVAVSGTGWRIQPTLHGVETPPPAISAGTPRNTLAGAG